MSVTHHTLLEHRGGATRIAALLRRELGGGHTFQVAETAAGQARLAARPWPQALESARAKGGLAHLHSTENWPGLLENLDSGLGPLIITLHDAALVTGGCCAPLDCPQQSSGCALDCPRGFPAPRDYRARVKAALARFEHVLACPSRWIADLARQTLPEADIRIIPGGVDWPAAVPDKAAAKQALGLSPAARLAVFAAHGGLDAAYKAGNAWLDLWAAIKARAPAALGFMIGGQETRRQGDLFFWPYVDRARMDAFLAAADVLVYPTLADTQGLVVLEAMAQGAAVVASNVGGVAEQGVPGQTILLEDGLPMALAAPAAKLLTHPLRARRLGQAAFAWGQRQRTTAHMAHAYANLYQELTE